jgi:hypothetical protein
VLGRASAARGSSPWAQVSNQLRYWLNRSRLSSKQRPSKHLSNRAPPPTPRTIAIRYGLKISVVVSSNAHQRVVRGASPKNVRASFGSHKHAIALTISPSGSNRPVLERPVTISRIATAAPPIEI